MDEKFPDRIDSKFRYVLLASARAEQMMRGARPLITIDTTKPTTVAMAEVTHDRVDWGYGPSPSMEDEEMILNVAPVESADDEDAEHAEEAEEVH